MLFRSIDFAKELDCESVQVSLAHAYPGTELYNISAQNGVLHGEAIADDGGHQLPHLEYPGLTREMMMSEVHRFYDEYFFRPRVAWRFVRDRLWDANDRKRLYHEAVDFMKLRAQRRKLSRKGMDKKTMVAVPSLETIASGGSGNEAHRA